MHPPKNSFSTLTVEDAPHDLEGLAPVFSLAGKD
jgi:hypothetical protein